MEKDNFSNNQSKDLKYTGELRLHPILGSLIGRKTFEVSNKTIDNIDELKEFEISYLATKYIEEWFSPKDLSALDRALGTLNQNGHIVDRINNQFALKILPCLLAEDYNSALLEFRTIIPNTIDEEMVLLINDIQFKALYWGLKEFIHSQEETVNDRVSLNLIEIEKADKMQFSGRATRNLEQMLEKGMTFTINPDHIDKIRQAQEYAGEGILPVTEYVKNEKVLGVSGFIDSKVSLAVHDFMDHIWTFSLLDKTGILEKYSDMFDSIGNPQATDIFKREGEIVASIGFGVRYFQTMPPAFGPKIRSFHISEHLDKLFIAGDLTARHMDAYRHLKSLRKGSMDWQSLGFCFSNYVTELDEQRRKYGKIKQVDLKTRRIIGELDPMSPDFICFFIDAHKQLMTPKNKHRDDLFRFHILLEEYLSSFAKGEIPLNQQLTLTPEEIRGIDFTKTTLPPQRIQWMRNNPGFTATRDAII